MSSEVFMTGSEDICELQTDSIEDRVASPDWVEPESFDDGSISITEEEIEHAITASATHSVIKTTQEEKHCEDLEEALVIQMNTAHNLALRLMNIAERWADEAATYPETMNQLLSQAQKLMKIYQQGIETLSKVRRNGTQTVNVQHIHLADDSRAIVTGLTGALPGVKI